MDGWIEDVDQIRERVKSRRDEITAELHRPMESWPYPPQPEVSWIDIGDLTCRFAFSQSANPALSTAELLLSLNGREETFADVHLVAAPQMGKLSRWTLLVLGTQGEDGGMGLFLPIHDKYFSGPQPVSTDGNAITSWVIKFSGQPGMDFKLNGHGLIWGTVELEEVETNDGPMIKGVLKADVLKIPIH